MDIHIHRCWVDLDEQATHRIPPLHQRVVVSLHQREVQPPVLHRPPIHEHMLLLARPARHAGRTDVSPHPKGRDALRRQHTPRLSLTQFLHIRGLGDLRPEIDRQHRRVRPMQLPQPLPQRRGTLGVVRKSNRRQLPYRALVRHKHETDIRMRQRRQRQVMLDVRSLGFLAPQEFPARRQIEEQLAHLNGRAGRRRGRLHFLDLPSVHHHLARFTRGIFALPGRQQEATHTRNARQGFTAKTHR